MYKPQMSSVWAENFWGYLGWLGVCTDGKSDPDLYFSVQNGTSKGAHLGWRRVLRQKVINIHMCIPIESGKSPLSNTVIGMLLGWFLPELLKLLWKKWKKKVKKRCFFHKTFWADIFFFMKLCGIIEESKIKFLYETIFGWVKIEYFVAHQSLSFLTHHWVQKKKVRAAGFPPVESSLFRLSNATLAIVVR